jgi:hypothetical protein
VALATTRGRPPDCDGIQRLLDRVDYADVIVVQQLGEFAPNAVERVPKWTRSPQWRQP